MTFQSAVTLIKKQPDGQAEQREVLLSEEEHIHQQLHQVGLSNDGPEEEFADEAGRDGLQERGRQEDPGKALRVTRVQDLHHFAESVLGLLLQALHKQSGLQVWNIWPNKRTLESRTYTVQRRWRGMRSRGRRWKTRGKKED